MASGLILIVVIFTIITNYQTVSDFLRGMFYTPSSEMIQVREDLNLTPKGELIFNASRPEFNNEENFNENCYSFDENEAILGCYRDQRIFVYKITAPELSGILELTTAHELLHAVYERMSIKEKNELRSLLEKVYQENLATLKEEIDIYNIDKQLEEIYVRAGTEIKDLPEELEKHYAEVFNDQDKITTFYESYIKVFREIEAEIKALEAEMATLNAQIDAKSAEYENGVIDLNREIDGFNNCANTAGCFNSDYEFYVRRSELVGRQNWLQALYDEIEILINQYNFNVAKYNNNVIRNNNLQNIINSHVRVDDSPVENF